MNDSLHWKIVRFQSLLKCNAVQSSKTLKQTLLLALAELLHQHAAILNDSTIGDDFLVLLYKELKETPGQLAAHRFVLLTAIGSLGTVAAVPLLLPFVQANASAPDNTAERIRALLSLQRVANTSPEKVGGKLKLWLFQNHLDTGQQKYWLHCNVLGTACAAQSGR